MFKRIIEKLKDGTEVPTSTNADGLPSSQTIAKPNVVRRFWYRKEVQMCVLCGREKITKERVYNENEKGIKCIDYACGDHFM